MYHLRDTYVAYDGTVRSSYGQQITQFTYDTVEDMYTDGSLEGEIGAPVGSWAAGSISEAAYGALDHPVNILEDSPLISLQVTFFYSLLLMALLAASFLSFLYYFNFTVRMY
jgi:DNA-directed RNA polymerase-4 subunit 1